MGEVIWVWNPARHGSVKSEAEAGTLIDMLSDRIEADADAQVINFIQKLTQDYPTPAMKPNRESAWDSEEILGYAKNRQPSAAFGFRLPSTPSTPALMGAVLSWAEYAGLAVFDPQRNWVWLPGGVSFPKAAVAVGDGLKSEALANAPRGWVNITENPDNNTISIVSVASRRQSNKSMPKQRRLTESVREKLGALLQAFNFSERRPQTLETLASAPHEQQPGWLRWAKLMHSELRPLLLAAGFEDRTEYPLAYNKDHGTFVRPIEGGVQTVSIRVCRIRDYKHPDDERWGCGISAVHDYEGIEAVRKARQIERVRAGIQKGLCAVSGGMVLLDFEFFLGVPRNVSPLGSVVCIEVAEGRKQVKDTLRDQILPLMDQTRTLGDVDWMFNRGGSPLADRLYSMRPNEPRLMVAKWCGNPRYDELRQRYLAGDTTDEFRRFQEEWLGIIDGLERRF